MKAFLKSLLFCGQILKYRFFYKENIFIVQKHQKAYSMYFIAFP